MTFVPCIIHCVFLEFHLQDREDPNNQIVQVLHQGCTISTGCSSGGQSRELQTARTPEMSRTTVPSTGLCVTAWVWGFSLNCLFQCISLIDLELYKHWTPSRLQLWGKDRKHSVSFLSKPQTIFSMEHPLHKWANLQMAESGMCQGTTILSECYFKNIPTSMWR